MAKAQVTHSEDAVQITFKGDKRRPEPSTGVIKFPGGHVEVSRCSDGSYWAHIEFADPKNNAESRIDYSWDQNEHESPVSVGDMAHADRIQHIAVRVTNTVPHFDPDTAA